MRASVEIHPRDRTTEGFAAIEIFTDSGDRLCRLDLEFSQLARLRAPQPEAFEFLLLANAVYALDKLVQRRDAGDAWTRNLALSLPVSNVPLWTAVAPQLNHCLSFLTGDVWEIAFTQRQGTLVRPLPVRRRRRRFIPPPTGNVVSLFSGGLDSLIGIINHLEGNPQDNILLVGHHDGEMAGPKSDQTSLLDPLLQEYPRRIRSVLARVGHANQTVDTEITLRGRSLIFIALGMYAAASLGPAVPLLIPENGTIALNVPLTPSRRGSCSTRTAHPHYLTELGRILTQLGLANPIRNPLEDKTKGEAVAECRNPALLANIAHLSVSCAKRGHRRWWTRTTAKACGHCMPCIYRRAALHSIDLDLEIYGDDICTGEVDLNSDGETPNDLRACFSFLNRNPSQSAIAKMLIANGSLSPFKLSAHAAMVQRTMDEVRALLRDKGTPTVRRMAGIP